MILLPPSKDLDGRKALTEAIARAGGMNALAKLLGLSRERIRQWRDRDRAIGRTMRAEQVEYLTGVPALELQGQAPYGSLPRGPNRVRKRKDGAPDKRSKLADLSFRSLAHPTQPQARAA